MYIYMHTHVYRRRTNYDCIVLIFLNRTEKSRCIIFTSYKKEKKIWRKKNRLHL